jgi:hypothetical protein
VQMPQSNWPKRAGHRHFWTSGRRALVKQPAAIRSGENRDFPQTHQFSKPRLCCDQDVRSPTLIPRQGVITGNFCSEIFDDLDCQAPRPCRLRRGLPVFRHKKGSILSVM